ncbi:hypothetical protein UFOVP156_41 [uncultured Caudovirales phage]|uniref:Uncharacterized protein n=1 Tax=uncultured Caudovirales phage TaxID=2100421 RepID=A0A6J7WEP4_9CAUD|nr:hypothetical protein UFOVP156_41 [uncultured Caudovirales phage]
MRRAEQIQEQVFNCVQQINQMSMELRLLLADMQSREQELVKLIDKQARHIEALELDLHMYDREPHERTKAG